MGRKYHVVVPILMQVYQDVVTIPAKSILKLIEVRCDGIAKLVNVFTDEIFEIPHSALLVGCVVEDY